MKFNASLAVSIFLTSACMFSASSRANAQASYSCPDGSFLRSPPGPARTCESADGKQYAVYAGRNREIASDSLGESIHLKSDGTVADEWVRITQLELLYDNPENDDSAMFAKIAESLQQAGMRTDFYYFLRMVKTQGPVPLKEALMASKLFFMIIDDEWDPYGLYTSFSLKEDLKAKLPRPYDARLLASFTVSKDYQVSITPYGDALVTYLATLMPAQ